MNLAEIRARAESELKDKAVSGASGTPTYPLEKRIALRNCGVVDPDSIGDYILRGSGYSGLARALEMGSEDVIAGLEKSGLRGRGGAGFPTAVKWQACRGTAGDEKYVICDAVDADPKAVTARMLLEGDPYAVLEGMLLGAYAVGAHQGFICVNDDYSVALSRLEKALGQMRVFNLLGEKILDSDFDFEIDIKAVLASLVMGEETALIRFLEGRQAIPYMRPPYPTVSGLNSKPTLVNNIETFANVSAVFQGGAEPGEGTKVITLAGAVKNPGTFEVPFGTTLKTLVEDIGGGVENGKEIKAVQVGGPAGIYIGAASLDTPLDYDAIKELGGMVGSGTIEVFAGDACAVALARDALAYLQAESCGKCVFCREGSYQMADILNDICEGKGKPEDIDLLLKIAGGMKAGSICGLGRQAASPVVSSLALFGDDYDAHVNGKKCPVKNG